MSLAKEFTSRSVCLIRLPIFSLPSAYTSNLLPEGSFGSLPMRPNLGNNILKVKSPVFFHRFSLHKNDLLSKNDYVYDTVSISEELHNKNRRACVER
jgi:hypothetical protein